MALHVDREKLLTGDHPVRRLHDPHFHPHGYSESDRVATAGEYVGICCHGIDVTHIDALSHMFFDRMMYNGKPAGLVTSVDGATHHAMTALREGIVTRGVLLDIPSLRGVDYLLPGDAVFPDDLDAAAARQGVMVERGDVVLLRTGNGHRRAPTADPAGHWQRYPAWHPTCLPWLSEHEVAAIGHDGPQDLVPAPYPNLHVPMHAIGIVARNQVAFRGGVHVATAAANPIVGWHGQAAATDLHAMDVAQRPDA